METHARTRFNARVRRRRLDRDLAAGCDLHRSEAHELRAAQLTDRSNRVMLARSLRSVVDDADHPSDGLIHPIAVPLRSQVRGFRCALLDIAEELESPGSVNPLGVARLELLLTDGAGPLYNRNADRSLIEAIWWVADGLAAPIAVGGRFGA